MAIGRDDIFGFFTEQLAIPTGVTAAITPVPGQVGIMLKYVSGGSLSIVSGATIATQDGRGFGSTYALASHSYLLATTEILSSNQAGTFYLSATGSTSVCALIRLMTAPLSSGNY